VESSGHKENLIRLKENLISEIVLYSSGFYTRSHRCFLVLEGARHEGINMKYSAKQRKIMDNLFLWKSASATSLCKSFYSPRKLRLFFSLIDSWRAHQKTPALALDLPPNKGRASVTQVNAMRFTTMSVVTFRTSKILTAQYAT
jgi:hypothetical protein